MFGYCSGSKLLIALSASLYVVLAPVMLAQMGQGHVVIDAVDLFFIAVELPADGITGCNSITAIDWHIEGGMPPPNPRVTVTWMALDRGHFTNANQEVPLAAHPTYVGNPYLQDTVPSKTDYVVTGQASAGTAVGYDTVQMRGVALEIVKCGPEELYSGTQTGKASCEMYVKAFCPSNPQLTPHGKVTATVVGQGVWLKDGAEWKKSLERDLVTGNLPGPPPQGPFMLAQFTVAADNPSDLPHDPVTAPFTATLSGSTDITDVEEVPVLVPRFVEHPEPGETVGVRAGEEFSGSLAWYADWIEGGDEGDVGEKYYWGASGKVTWNLPQGTVERTYHQNTFDPQDPCPYHSPQTAQAGLGDRVLTEEHYHSVTCPVKVTPNPGQWAEEAQGFWKPPYDFLHWIIETACYAMKKAFGAH